VTESPSEDATSRDPVAQRILTMLEACAASRRPMTIKDLAEATGLAKSTVHRMCWKLEGLGLLEHSDRGFSVGTKMLSIANSNPLVNELRSLAIPHLVNLQQLSGASHLAMLADGKALVVDGLYTQDLRAYTLVGYGLPMHCTAAGKALLARLEPEERDEWFASHPLRPATPQSVVNPEALRRQLDKVTEAGFAISNEEFQRGIVAVAAGLLVRPGVYAAVACVGSSADKAILRSAPQVVVAAKQLEQALARRYEMRRLAAQ
jgi:DNA-binding IclR family transcriptional regulator